VLVVCLPIREPPVAKATPSLASRIHGGSIGGRDRARPAPFLCRAVDMVGEFSDLTITALHSRLKRPHLPEAEKAEASADAG
jgi:hypothetical protein